MGTEKPRAKYGFVLGVAVARSDDLGSGAYVAVDATNNALYTPRPLAANGVPHLHRHHHHQFNSNLLVFPFHSAKQFGQVRRKQASNAKR